MTATNADIVEFFRGLSLTWEEANTIANVYERKTKDYTGAAVLRECGCRAERPRAAVSDRPADPPSSLEFPIEETLKRLNAGRDPALPPITEADLKSAKPLPADVLVK